MNVKTAKRSMINRIIAVAVWILIWQLLALVIDKKVLLPGPADTLRALFGMFGNEDFLKSVWATTIRILLGFFLGLVLGIVLAYAANLKPLLDEFLKPPVLALKSVPVASFVILLLIWFGSSNISIIICSMVVFPILYLSTLEGLRSTDKKLLEMAKVFRMPGTRMVRFILLPNLKPFWKSAFKLAVGMSFKSGIAAEVIGQPLHTIGNGLYLSKVYLETAELFSWTIVVVFIAFVCEKILGFLVDRI